MLCQLTLWPVSMAGSGLGLSYLHHERGPRVAHVACAGGGCQHQREQRIMQPLSGDIRGANCTSLN